MKFLTSKELRNNPALLWGPDEDETIITVNGKPKVIVLKVENDVEEQLKSIRALKAQMALEKLRMYSVQQGFNSLSNEEIISEIKKIREEK